MTKTITDATFDEEVAGADGAVLVDFWAEWCGPCKMVAPILDEIDQEEGGLTVAKLNIDDSPSVAQRFKVMSIPTMILFKDGEEQARIVGAKPKKDILAEISGHL